MSSRERMLAALENREPDHTPCCFMIFTALLNECKDRKEFVERQLDMGLDVRVELPELPFRLHPGVKVKTWQEKAEGEKDPLLYKQYATPEGDLTTIVRKTEDWPYGNEVPLFNDFLSPRAKQFPIAGRDDLPGLKYLLGEPTPEDISGFKNEAKIYRELAEEKELLLSGGWRSGAPEKGIDREGGTMGADSLLWLYGGENALITAMEEPDVIQEVLETISAWNMKRMSIYLEQGIDLLFRRAWYESTELWSPELYRKLLFPILEKEIELTHRAGAKFAYIMTSGVTPLLDTLLELGIDVLVGVDPMMGNWPDLAELKKKMGGKVCLWGGVNGFLTIEKGSKNDVENAVRGAMTALAPGGGFILCPVDNVTNVTDRTWDNVNTMIETWQAVR